MKVLFNVGKRCRMVLLLQALMGLGLPAAPVQANLLDFDANACSYSGNGAGDLVSCTSYGFINQSYGDTAEVDVRYVDLLNPASSLRWWSSNYNNLYGVVWGGNGDVAGQSWNQIQILPTVGQAVSLHGFNLGAYPTMQRTTNVRILDGAASSLLLDLGSLLVGTGDVATAVQTQIISANGVTIEWRDTAYNVGIDDIDFSVVPVPLPAAAWLFLSGLVGLLTLQRQRSH